MTKNDKPNGTKTNTKPKGPGYHLRETTGKLCAILMNRAELLQFILELINGKFVFCLQYDEDVSKIQKTIA